MSTPLATLFVDLMLPADAAASIDAAFALTVTPLCTPAADVDELRAKLAAGERAPGALVRSSATAPMPGDAALVGALVRLLLPRADVVVDDDVAVPLDQSACPARGQVVVPGSLHVRGDLRVVAPLVVCGDLVVDGGVLDCGPQSVIVVLGDLRCRSLRTTGEVLVSGALDADTFVWGQNNDNVLEVHGTLRTAVLMSDDHAIEAGTIEVKHRPPEGGTWGDETFDMSSEHTAALAGIAADVDIVSAAGDVDIDHLASLAAPWR